MWSDTLTPSFLLCPQPSFSQVIMVIWWYKSLCWSLIWGRLEQTHLPLSCHHWRNATAEMLLSVQMPEIVFRGWDLCLYVKLSLTSPLWLILQPENQRAYINYHCYLSVQTIWETGFKLRFTRFWREGLHRTCLHTTTMLLWVKRSHTLLL